MCGGGGGGGGGGGVVVDDSVWQESMRSEVEHSWTFLFHPLVFLLCLHHPCLSCLSFLFLFRSLF